MLGVGLGGFVDGIVAHQLLQWHHMISSTERTPTTLAGLESNTVADGAFHAFAWLCVLVGVFLLRRPGRAAPTARGLAGALLVGWGGFNLVEGIVDHHLLRVHHVRDDVGSPLAWDLGFLALGVALVAIGLVLDHQARPATTAPPSTRAGTTVADR